MREYKTSNKTYWIHYGNMSWFNKTKKYEDIYIILNSIKIMNRDPLIFNVIENYNEGEQWYDKKFL